MDVPGPVLSGRLLTRNVALNLAGYGLPVAAALVALPLLVAALGEARFGLLILAWALAGSFGVLDLGLGRALIKVVAERLDDPCALAARVTTGLALVIVLGIVVGGLFFALVPWLPAALEVPEALRAETLAAFRLLALSLPLTMIGIALRGVLEAGQRFAAVNAVRIPAATAIFVGPLLVLPFSDSLVWVLAILVLARLAAAIAYLLLVRRFLPPAPPAPELALAPELLRLGGWMTVSNALLPLLLYFDRFVVARLVSLEAVSWYATPVEILERVSLLSIAFMGVLFPAFSTLLGSAPERARRLYRRSRLLLAAVLVPVTLLVILGARPMLELWLGASFAENSTRVAQLVAVGALANGLAQPAFNLIQAAGRADWTAKIHLIAAPLYAVLLVVLTLRFGIVGAAFAWTLRMIASSLAFTLLARRLLPTPEDRGRRAGG